MKLKFVPLSVRQDSQCRLFILYGIAAPDGKVGKNSRGNGHFFHFAGLRVIGNHLRSLAHPAPIILSVAEIFLQSPATPHGKFLAALRVDCREISENQGFSPVDYIQVAVLIVGINLIPKIVKHLNIRIRAVTEEKANIRGIHPFFTHSPVFPENCFINIGERFSVCHIKVNKIHTDVCEHGSVFANDPTVCGKIITEIGFCPIMCPTQRAAGNRFLKCLRTSLCINSIVIIQELVRIGRVGRRMPDLIKNTDQFVCNSGSVTAHIPPCPVGCRPCITVKITDANGIRFRVRNTHFLLPLQRQIVIDHTAVVLVCPKCHVTNGIDIVTEGRFHTCLSRRVHNSNLTGIGNNYAKNQYTLALFRIGIHGNLVGFHVILNVHTPRSRKIKLRFKQCDIGPGVDHTNRTVLKSQPDSFGTDRCKLIIIPGQTQPDISGIMRR